MDQVFPCFSMVDEAGNWQFKWSLSIRAISLYLTPATVKN